MCFSDKLFQSNFINFFYLIFIFSLLTVEWKKQNSVVFLSSMKFMHRSCQWEFKWVSNYRRESWALTVDEYNENHHPKWCLWNGTGCPYKKHTGRESEWTCQVIFYPPFSFDPGECLQRNYKEARPDELLNRDMRLRNVRHVAEKVQINCDRQAKLIQKLAFSL